MSGPVEFVSTASGSIEALIGNTLVGLIQPWPPNLTWKTETVVVAGPIEATMKMLMPIQGGIEMAAPMMSIAGARRTLLHRLAEWHQSASPSLYANMITALRMQAEGERG